MILIINVTPWLHSGSAEQSPQTSLGYLETKSPTWPPLGNNLDGFFCPASPARSGVRQGGPQMGSPDLPRPQTVTSSLSVRTGGHLSPSLHTAASREILQHSGDWITCWLNCLPGKSCMREPGQAPLLTCLLPSEV